jgi:hydrogenase large subunit
MTATSTANGFTLNDGGRRIVVDPVTRIEGHMRVEINIDANNTVTNAVSSGTMWRGIETILKNRDPRDAWAFAQRICGVCTGVHAMASVRAVEDALGIPIPRNANLIRNILHLTLFVQDHLVHFYHLHALDWVDVMSALRANPGATAALAQSLSPWPTASTGYFRNVRSRLERFVTQGQLGLFKNGYWGHPAYKLSPEANLMAVAHYLEALDFQKEIVKIHAVLAGKNPHPMWLVGGVPSAINMHGGGAVGAINIERLSLVRDMARRARDFVAQVYIPDLMAIASFYKDWANIGGGLSGRNLMSFGEFPRHPGSDSNDNLLIPRGAIINGRFEEVLPVDPRSPQEIREFVPHSWYRYPDEGLGLHPWDGVTELDFRLGPRTKGDRTRIEELDEGARYSYIKAPRWKGHAMEVGPLARLAIGYAMGRTDIKDLVDGGLARLGVPLPALFSTLGRTAARGLECQWAADRLVEAVDDLYASIKAGDLDTANTDKWAPETWPATARGVGICEAPRGALGHWICIEDRRIANYQCVVPTTWNGSPRDIAGAIGPFEAALLGTPVIDPAQPLEVLRTIHSFDPCLACATHIMDAQGNERAVVQVL